MPKILIPQNLQLEQIARQLPMTNLPLKEKNIPHLYAIIGLVVRSKALNGGWVRKESNFFPLCAKYLRRIHLKYDKLLEYLIQAGIIETDGSFIIGEKCRGYKLKEEYEGTGLREHKIENYILRKNIRKTDIDIELQHKDKLKNYMHIVKWYLTGKLEINKEAALNWLNQYCEQNAALLQDERNLRGLKDVCNATEIFIDKLVTKSISYKDLTYCAFGYRLHGVFTNLIKEIRNFITYDSLQLISCDIKNSQPYFSSLLFDKSFWQSKKTRTKKLQLNQLRGNIYKALRKSKALYNCITLLDSSESLMQQRVSTGLYKNLVTSGQLYEFLQKFFLENLSSRFLEKYVYRILDRKMVKKEVLKIMYADNKMLPHYEPARAFSRIFPHVARLFYLIKQNEIVIAPPNKKGHTTLSALLQRIESKMVLDVICTRIAREKPDLPIFTIHDSIVTTKGNENYVKDIIIQELTQKIGIAPQVQFEEWKMENALIPKHGENGYICLEDLEVCKDE